MYYDVLRVLNLVLFWLLQEVRRIRNAHPDDPAAVINDRVKGSLKVTRAFGAGFLKNVNPLFLSLFNLYCSLSCLC